MESRNLRYFQAVAKHRSFSKAAENLFVTQSSVSKNIAALETELGKKLFFRRSHGLELTKAGEALYEGVEEILKKQDLLKEFVSGISNVEPRRNQLIFSLMEPVPNNVEFCRILIETSLDFKRRYAPIKMDFRYDNNIQEKPSLYEDEPDIYFQISTTPELNANYNTKALTEENFVLMVAQSLLDKIDNPDPIHILRTHPVLFSMDVGNAILDVSEVFTKLKIKPNIRYIKSIMAMMMEISMEEGVTVIPKQSAARLSVAGVTELKLPDNIPHISLYAQYNKKNKNPLVPMFVETISKKMKEMA
ncbi:MAG: LysR family transcriptional regulator [Eubacterium sp.]|nr:LysR family transcriptional regulator [Eubacterium sp.]